MNIEIVDKNLILTDTNHFDIALCLDCGQAFRWKKAENGIWQGIAYGKFLSLKQEENKIIFFNTTKEDFENLWVKYFDLERDYDKILSSSDKVNMLIFDVAEVACV